MRSKLGFSDNVTDVCLEKKKKGEECLIRLYIKCALVYKY